MSIIYFQLLEKKICIANINKKKLTVLFIHIEGSQLNMFAYYFPSDTFQKKPKHSNDPVSKLNYLTAREWCY